LDEPTNDLDAETLELLESVLLNFKGTLLLVSHDREFINNVVTSSLVFDDDGMVRFYAGGYDDWLEQKPKSQKLTQPQETKEKPEEQENKKRKITFSQQHELDALPEKIETLEDEQSQLHEKMATPDFYEKEGHHLTEINTRLEKIETELTALYERWQELDALSKK
jgi:ATP-binding cassette subfamily F protein uup